MAFNYQENNKLYQLRSNKTLFYISKVQKNVCEINRLLKQKLENFKKIKTHESPVEKEVIKCDSFELCKIFIKEEFGHQSNEINNKIDNKLFKCVWPQCRYNTYNKWQLNQHISIYSDHNSFKCEYNGCNESFRSKKYLKRHQKLHSKIKLCCAHCYFETNYEFHMKRHSLIHSNEKNFKCDFENCNKFFKNNTYLKAHKLIHSKRKKFKCDKKL